MLYYITGNQNKIETAKKYLDQNGISFEGKKLELIEPQSESIEEVAISKAKQAFEQLREPLFVNDSGWSITTLKGFPGPFMKYINDWLTPEDLLNLMKDKQNREVILEEVVVYMDKDKTKVFTHKISGKFLNESKGEGIASDCVVSLHPSGKSIAECREEGIKSSESSTLWEEFGKWLQENAIV